MNKLLLITGAAAAFLPLSLAAHAAGPMLTEWGERVTSANVWRG